MRQVVGERTRFSPDDSGRVYLREEGPSPDLWLLDLTTMEGRRLTRFDSTPTVRTFDITPDGRRIVFDRLTTSADVVLIELGGPAPGRQGSPPSE